MRVKNLVGPPGDGAGSAKSVYEGLAEFHDLFMGAAWENLRGHVRAAFEGLGPEAVIVEIGAGTGMGTRVIAAESPARVVALEPSLVMRSVLTARVADSADLASRVTVMAGGVPQALQQLPARVDGLVCAHMLGHLDPPVVRQLFAWVDDRLSLDGVVLVTVQEPSTGDRALLPEVMGTRRLGDYEYRATYQPTPSTEGFLSRYEVWHGDQQVRQAEFRGRWRIVTGGDVADQIIGLRLETTPLATGVVLVRRPSST